MTPPRASSDATSFGPAQATRRRFLTTTGAAAALAMSGTLPGILPTASAEQSTMRRNPFTLGIASGDPLSDAIVIWTRLAPDPLDPFGGMGSQPVGVEWEVATDDRFRRRVRTGTATARREWSHTVHVDVKGLRPWTHYFYRFRVGSHVSPVGRMRTAPAPGASIEKMAFAFASCQAWWEGFYTPYRDMAAHDHDVVLHLGDYIYEFGVGTDSGVRQQPVPDHYVRETVTLDEYRARYALYKTDPDLQSAHAAAAWIVTLDDHEVDNNWAGPYPENAQDQFLIRRANALRAYWEHMPMRLAQTPTGPDMQIYRRFQYGDLARFNVLDTRQYRDNQANGDGIKPPSAESQDPNRTITGHTQEKWLLDGIAERSAQWEILAHQTAIAQLDTVEGPDIRVPMDTWDGYTASRKRVLAGAMDRGVRNLVSVAGDLHRSLASELKPDYGDESAASVGTEFIGTSITSGRDGMDVDEDGRILVQENEHIKFGNFQRGYVRCELSTSAWITDFRVADRVTIPDGTMSTRARLLVEDGNPTIQTA